MAITTIWSDVLDSASGTVAGYTFRQVIASADLSDSASRIRITLAAPPGNTCAFDNVSIVERDPGTPNGVTTPTEILFGGTSGVSIASGDEEISDWLDFNIDATKDYLICMDLGSSATYTYFTASGGGGDYYLASADSYNVQNMPPGYTTQAGYTRSVVKIEKEPRQGAKGCVIWW